MDTVWTEPLDANKEVYPCQRDLILKVVTGSENCLLINVYTKNVEPTKKCPVMVFFYGGGFVCGANVKDMYNPEFLLRKDIVLVLVNYRVGAFGECIYLFLFFIIEIILQYT